MSDNTHVDACGQLHVASHLYRQYNYKAGPLAASDWKVIPPCGAKINSVPRGKRMNDFSQSLGHRFFKQAPA